MCEAIISICNRWELGEFKTTCKLVFNSFWKPLVSSLYFPCKPNQTKHYSWLQVLANKETIPTLKYAFLIQTLSSSFQVEMFQAIQRLDKLCWVENSKACWCAKYENWIHSQAGINTNLHQVTKILTAFWKSWK